MTKESQKEVKDSINIDWGKWSDMAKEICESSDMMKSEGRKKSEARTKN
jgi:hypothetical protein